MFDTHIGMFGLTIPHFVIHYQVKQLFELTFIACSNHGFNSKSETSIVRQTRTCRSCDRIGLRSALKTIITGKLENKKLAKLNKTILKTTKTKQNLSYDNYEKHKQFHRLHIQIFYVKISSLK